MGMAITVALAFFLVLALGVLERRTLSIMAMDLAVKSYTTGTA